MKKHNIGKHGIDEMKYKITELHETNKKILKLSLIFSGIAVFALLVVLVIKLDKYKQFQEDFYDFDDEDFDDDLFNDDEDFQ